MARLGGKRTTRGRRIGGAPAEKVRSRDTGGYVSGRVQLVLWEREVSASDGLATELVPAAGPTR